MSNLSPSTLALLRAAKSDAPSKESRAAIWGGVTSGLVTHTPLHITPQSAGSSAGSSAGASAASAPGMGAGTSIAPAAGAVATAKGGLLVGAAWTSGLTGMKGAFVGALFGSAISIGVATFMMRAKPADVSHAPTATQTVAQTGDAKSGGASSIANPKSAIADSNAESPAAKNQSSNANSIAPSIEVGALPTTSTSSNSRSASNSAGSSVSGSNSKSSNASSSSNAKSMTDDTQTLQSKKSATPVALDDGSLDREGSLVREARRDLLTGDPAAALKTVMKARALDARQMEPEEMDVQAKALRALGRDADALKVESQLRTMYPGQTLGR